MLLFAAKNRPFTEIVCRIRKITARNRFRAIDERDSFLIQARLANGLDSQSDLIGRQDQRHAHMPLTRRTKARARRHHNAGLLHKLLAKRHGIGATTGKLGPHKHRAMRVGTLPAQALKTVAQGIAALLVLQTLRLDLIARTVQAGDSSLLDREEHT